MSVQNAYQGSIVRPPSDDREGKNTLNFHVRQALNAIGVGVGEHFAVVKVDPSAPPVGSRVGRLRDASPNGESKVSRTSKPVGTHLKFGSQRHRILAAISTAGLKGMTAEEVRDTTGIDGAWKRLSEMRQNGCLYPHGERPTRASVPSTVYVLTSLGQEVLDKLSEEKSSLPN